MGFNGISLAPTQPWMGREKPPGNEHLDPENHHFFLGEPNLVGGFKHVLCSIIYGIILPIDFHMFQDG